MIRIDTANKTLVAYTDAPASTNEPDFVTAYDQIDTATPDMTPGSNDGTLNGTTPVTLVNNAGTVPVNIKYVNINNTDTQARTVTVALKDSTNYRLLVTATLQPGEAIVYNDGAGWKTFTTSGAVKTEGISGYSGAAGLSGFSGISGATGSTGTSGFSGFSGNTGATGSTGTSGFSGIGTSGFSGFSGSAAAGGGGGGINYVGRSGHFATYASSCSSTTATATLQKNYMHYYKFTPMDDFTIGEMSIEITTAAAGGKFQFYVYSDVAGFPAVRLYKSGDVTATTTGVKTATGVNLAVTAGTQYWLVIQPTWTSGNIVTSGFAVEQCPSFFVFSSQEVGYVGFIDYAGTYGTVGNNPTANAQTQNVAPAILCKVIR